MDGLSEKSTHLSQHGLERSGGVEGLRGLLSDRLGGLLEEARPQGSTVADALEPTVAILSARHTASKSWDRQHAAAASRRLTRVLWWLRGHGLRRGDGLVHDENARVALGCRLLPSQGLLDTTWVKFIQTGLGAIDRPVSEFRAEGESMVVRAGSPESQGLLWAPRDPGGAGASLRDVPHLEGPALASAKKPR